MNYKLLFPTFWNRYNFVKESLKTWRGNVDFKNAINIGTGEGDYDWMIKSLCDRLVGVDINGDDLEFAKTLNDSIPGIYYQLDDALDLSFPNNSFDLGIAVDVIEHVENPKKMILEISRILKPGGVAVITFPQIFFPISYDPINWILDRFSKKRISEGAYAFGHTNLIKPEQFKDWVTDAGLKILVEKNLSGYLVGLTEMYWTGWVQRIFKANHSNKNQKPRSSQLFIRPKKSIPKAVFLTECFCRLDYYLFHKSKYAVGKGVVLQKPV